MKMGYQLWHPIFYYKAFYGRSFIFIQDEKQTKEAVISDSL